jgi:diguanylate cyclase (GGDEF)-like protein/PAS domain S-box-containing protein
MDQRSVSQVTIEQNTLLLDIATRNVISLAPSKNIGDAAHIMAGKRISSLVVTDETNHPIGIVTERNILHAMQSGLLPETNLQIVMSHPVITVQESMTCLDAYQVCLRDGIRHLVIVDGDKRLLGVVSETDFRLHINLATLAGRRQIASIMSRSVFSLLPEANFQDALNLMETHRDTCVVVVKDNCPVGIITERDIVRLYSTNSFRTDITVSEVMTSPVLTIMLDYTINEAAELMLKSRVRHLVVINHAGQLAGLLSEHDLTHSMALGLIDNKQIAEGAFLHTLINTLPDLIWLKDKDGVYIACNRRFERFFGVNEKNIIGKTDYDFVDKSLADFFREHDRNAMEKDGSSINEEWITFADDGHRELLETVKSPMRDNQGKLIGVLGIGHDITERKHIEENLRESEEKLRGLYELSPLGIALTDMNGRYIEFNEAFCEICGYPADELKKLDYWTLTPQEYEQQENEQLESMSRTGRYGPYLKEYRQKNGKLIPIQLNGTLITGKNGQKYIWSIVEDITERKQAEQLLKESERQYRTLANSGQALIWTSGTDKLCDYFNNVWLDFTGRSLEQEIGNGWTVSVHADDIKRCQEVYVSSFDKREKFSMDYRLRRHDGEYRWIQDDGCPRFNSVGIFIGYIGYCLDITERKSVEAKLRTLSTAIEQSPVSVVIADLEANIEFVNPRFTEVTGYSAEEAIGQNPRILQSGLTPKETHLDLWNKVANGQIWHGELINKRKSGEVYWEDAHIAPVRDASGIITHYVATKVDITSRKSMEEKIQHMAQYDVLTDLPNRTLFSDRLQQALSIAKRDKTQLALMFIDLDKFKPVNDVFGHQMGDLLLKEAAKRMLECVRESDTIARIGGDEFVVLLPDIETEHDALLVAEKIRQALYKPFTLLGENLSISSSTGIVIYPGHGTHVEELFKNADVAMYSAKAGGRNAVILFNASMRN